MNVLRMVIFASLSWAATSLAVVSGFAEEKPTAPAKWEAEILKFEAVDKAMAPVPGGVVFYGSSSARLWDLKTSFPTLQTVNRGFGGSDMAAAAHFYGRVVPQHQPRVVVLYEGDNDLASKKTAKQILDDFESLITQHREALPNAKLICLTVKYSPSRAKLRAEQEATNALLKDRCSRDLHLEYVDLASTLLDDQGQPQAKYFKPDMLHLNPDGYAVWNAKLLPLLEESFKPASAAP